VRRGGKEKEIPEERFTVRASQSNQTEKAKSLRIFHSSRPIRTSDSNWKIGYVALVGVVEDRKKSIFMIRVRADGGWRA
jgi:hypothetical protein